MRHPWFAPILLCLMVPASLAAPAPTWQVFAIRYATIRSFPVRALVTGADTTRRQDIAMMVWLLKGPGGRRVLLDAGFHRQKFLDSWKPVDFVRPSDALRAFGVRPEDVTDVIVSHVHWDHMDGADLFPRARVWIQKEEYEHHVRPDGTPADRAIDSLDARMLSDLHAAGRVTLVDGDGREIIPGVTVYTGGRHTFASQYVGVRAARGTIVLASDNAYLYENLERRRPIAQTLDSTANLAAQERMAGMAGDPSRIVPGHDPAVFTRYREVRPGVVRIE